MSASSVTALHSREKNKRDKTRAKYADQTFQDSDESGSMSTITEQTYRAKVPFTPSSVSETVKASKEPLRLPSSRRKAPDRGFLRRQKHTLSPPFSAVSSIVSTPRGGYRPPTVESIPDSGDDSSVYKLAVAEDIGQPVPKTEQSSKGRGPRNASPLASSSCCSKCSQPINQDEDPFLADGDHPPSTLVSPRASTSNEDIHHYKEANAQNPPTGSPTHSVSKPLNSGEDGQGSPRTSRQASTDQGLNNGGSHDASDEINLPSQRCVSSEPRTFSVHTASPPTMSEQPGQQYARQGGEQSYDYASLMSQSPPQRGQGLGAWPESQPHLATEQHQGRDGRREQGERFQRAKDFFTKGYPYQSSTDSHAMADDAAHVAQDQHPKATPPYDFSRLFGTQSAPKTYAYCDPPSGRSSSFTDADVHALYDQVPSFSRAGFGGNEYHGYDDNVLHGGEFDAFPGSDPYWEPGDPYIDDDGHDYDSNYEDEDDGPPNHFANPDDEASLVLWENPIVEDITDDDFERTACHKGKTASSSRSASPKERVQGSLHRLTSTLQVAEYNSSDSDSDSDIGSAFRHASTVRVKKYNRMVECEVASASDDESGRPHSPVRMRCRASIRATQIDY